MWIAKEKTFGMFYRLFDQKPLVDKDGTFYILRNRKKDYGMRLIDDYYRLQFVRVKEMAVMPVMDPNVPTHNKEQWMWKRPNGDIYLFENRPHKVADIASYGYFVGNDKSIKKSEISKVNCIEIIDK